MLSLALSFVCGSVAVIGKMEEKLTENNLLSKLKTEIWISLIIAPKEMTATHPYYEFWVNSGNIGYMTIMLEDGLKWDCH